MAYWMCVSCGHCINDSRPPGACPHCGQKCSFGDVTCYRPECGGEHNIDPLLTGALMCANPKGVDKITNGAKRPVIYDIPAAFSPSRSRGPEW